MKGALLLFSCWDVTLFLKKKKKNRLQLPSYSPFIHVSQHVFKESKIFKLILIVKIFRERGRVISLIHVHMYCYSPCLWGATCLYIVVDEVGAFGTWGTSFITILYVFLNCSSLFLSSTPLKSLVKPKILDLRWTSYDWKFWGNLEISVVTEPIPTPRNV